MNHGLALFRDGAQALGAIQKLRHAKGREGFAKTLLSVTKREGGVPRKRYVAKSVNKYIGKIGEWRYG